jgi:hypothetical protein
VYLNHTKSDRKKSINRLIEQLAVAHINNPARIGFLIGVYAYWPEYKKKKESFSEFRLSLGRLLRERTSQGAPGFEIRMDHQGAMETVLKETPAKIGAAEVVVGCVAQYFKLTSTTK